MLSSPPLWMIHQQHLYHRHPVSTQRIRLYDCMILELSILYSILKSWRTEIGFWKAQEKERRGKKQLLTRHNWRSLYYTDISTTPVPHFTVCNSQTRHIMWKKRTGSAPMVNFTVSIQDFSAKTSLQDRPASVFFFFLPAHTHVTLRSRSLRWQKSVVYYLCSDYSHSKFERHQFINVWTQAILQSFTKLSWRCDLKLYNNPANWNRWKFSSNQYVLTTLKLNSDKFKTLWRNRH